MPATTGETLTLVSKQVVVAPMVLLSAADHYGRSAKNTKKRVVGVLLGQNTSKDVRVTNSFAVPFEEDEKDPSVWFLDHNYITSMLEMFKKVNAREKLVGWYHSGPRLRASDQSINELFKRYTPNPLLVIIDVQPKEVGVPTDAYHSIEEIRDDGLESRRVWVHSPTTIEAEEAEEIGVEHLLRDIRDVAVGTLSARITSQLQSLQGLHVRLRDIGAYLDKVLAGTLPVNHQILGNLQDMFNLLPNLTTSPASESGRNSVAESELARSMTVKTNDQLMTIYLSSLVRAITAFHDLIENKIQNRKAAEEREGRLENGEDKEKEDKKNGEVKTNGVLNGESEKGSSTDLKDKKKEGGEDEKGKKK